MPSGMQASLHDAPPGRPAQALRLSEGATQLHQLEPEVDNLPHASQRSVTLLETGAAHNIIRAHIVVTCCCFQRRYAAAAAAVSAHAAAAHAASRTLSSHPRAFTANQDVFESSRSSTSCSPYTLPHGCYLHAGLFTLLARQNSCMHACRLLGMGMTRYGIA